MGRHGRPKPTQAEISAARDAYRQAVERWRAAGGSWPVGGEPSHPEQWAVVRYAGERYGQLCADTMPADRDGLLRRVRAGERFAIEAAIAWLCTDPFADGTGYYKQKVMRRLSQVALTDDDRQRLREMLLQVCSRGKRQEFSEACRLARRQLASESFAEELDRLSGSAPAETTREAARRMALAVRSTLR